MNWIKNVKKLYQMHNPVTATWVLVWFPIAVFFLAGYSCVVGIINLSIEDMATTFRDGL